MESRIVILLYILGLYLPTSFGYSINHGIRGMYGVALFLLLMVSILYSKKIPKNLFLVVLCMNVLLFLSTILSPFIDYSIGAIIPFACLSLLFCFSLKEVTIGEKAIKIFKYIAIINLALGFLIVLDNTAVKDFFLKFYADYYENLLPNMFYNNKPVLFFSSHSRAAFHLFLFFFMLFVTFKETKRKVYLFLSMGYILLLFNLSSNTGYMFLVLSVMMLSVHLLKYNFRFLVYFLLSISAVMMFNLEKVKASINESYLIFYYTVTSKGNGIFGRFSEDGQLANNIRYLMENYFRPVGYGYSDDLFFSDSGMILYTLRGTFLLTILIYLGFYLYLRRSLDKKYQIIILFLAFFLMDIGSPAFTYIRTLFMIPFIVIYIKSVSLLKKDKNVAGAMITEDEPRRVEA